MLPLFGQAVLALPWRKHMEASFCKFVFGVYSPARLCYNKDGEKGGRA